MADAVHDSEEAGIVGEFAVEVGDGVAVAVEIDPQFIGRLPVERFPVLHTGHVDVLLEAEVGNFLCDKEFLHFLEVLDRIEVVRVLLGAGSRAGRSLLEENVNLRGLGNRPFVGSGHLVDGDGQDIGDAVFQARSADLELGGSRGAAIAGHHDRGRREFVR